MSDNPLLERNKNGNLVGKSPLNIDVNDLKDAGHLDEPLCKVIRKNCIECCGSASEVNKCVHTTCPLWPHRKGTNPFLAEKRKGKGGFAS